MYSQRDALTVKLLTTGADFDFWFGGIADASPNESGNEFSAAGSDSKRNKPGLQPDGQQQPKQVDDKKTKGAFKGKAKRVPGSLGRVFEPRQFHINMAKTDYTFVFYGRRRSGKSFLMRCVQAHHISLTL